MKIIHLADVHYCREHKDEVLTSLHCVRNYAKKNAADLIAVAGDLFDSATLNSANTGFPLRSDRQIGRASCRERV
jgi:DNA repair exonuclease SbcCD nuclease subunit